MRELTRGLVFASLALLTVLAGLTLALSENRAALGTPKAPSQAAPTETLFVPSPVLPSRTPIDAFALLQTQAPDASSTPCPLPAGWERSTVADGDSLAGLAAAHGLSLAALLQANCLDHDSFYVGASIYMPVTTPTVAPTPACGPPLGWVYYMVRAGDTLFALSIRYGVSIYDLRQANCLPETAISVGQNLFVPASVAVVPTSSATFTVPPSQTATFTLVPSATGTSAPTLTASATNPPTATALTPTASPTVATATITATATETATSSATPELPTATLTDAPTLAETATLPASPTTPTP